MLKIKGVDSCGLKVKKSSLLYLSEPEQKYYDDFFVSEKDYFYMPSLHPQYIDISFYINHDNFDPNVRYDNDSGDFVTIKHINIGEELFYDYNSVEDADLL